jgi:hypothetical protein
MEEEFRDFPAALQMFDHNPFERLFINSVIPDFSTNF